MSDSIEFEDIDSLYEYIRDEVIDSLYEDVGKAVGDVLHEESVAIYDEYEPWSSYPDGNKYFRRYEEGESGAFGDRNVIVTDVVSDGTTNVVISVKNMAIAVGQENYGEYLDELIENGIYDWHHNADALAESGLPDTPPKRPVYKRTEKRLISENTHYNALVKSLRNKGYKVYIE